MRFGTAFQGCAFYCLIIEHLKGLCFRGNNERQASSSWITAASPALSPSRQILVNGHKAAIHIFDVAKLDRVSRKEKLDRGKEIRETVSVCERII